MSEHGAKTNTKPSALAPAGTTSPHSPNSSPHSSALNNLKAEMVRHQVKIPRSVDFGAYLESHSDLAEVVPSVCAQARQEFGKQSELILQLYRDPEIDDRHLSLIVRLPSYDQKQ